MGSELSYREEDEAKKAKESSTRYDAGEDSHSFMLEQVSPLSSSHVA
jgi:hypothetical protein